MRTLPFYILMAALSLYSINAKAVCPIAKSDNVQLQLTSDEIVINVIQNDNLVDNDSISVRLLSQPEFGSVRVDNITNAIIFSSVENRLGLVTFDYEVCGLSLDCGYSCSIATVELDVLSIPGVPEGLTLNGDGFNEGLRLTNIRDYNKLELTIVNRWGNVVFQNNNYKNEDPWRGTYGDSEELVEPGVYYYFLIPYRNGKRIGDVQTSALYIFN